ncbi:hypothetical protein DND132_0961 [Pseudodesulfovibrio mercurii]|uniref:Tripartite tricarboxylate transporter substrate binding protein n=1 Tax=Pseudodesulfovibrio mercurii TaxID=641491 RepID=F0JIC2_9BACT|nr:tripartite tricarboxylate transporter substrate binding protein [Pseudodesulfovibrio mercurii]EGB14174.1 hypothetical protein DND132_0961 [Pseudodesulfovibrio mercurii]
MIRRKFCLITISIFALLISSFGIAQAGWPERPVKFILGSQPGSSIDSIGRILAKLLSEKFGQPFVAMNITGGALGAFPMTMKNSKNDGYVIGMGADMNFSYTGLEKTADFNFDDFDYLCSIFKGDCSFICSGTREWTNIKDALEDVKAQSRPLIYLFQTSKDRLMMQEYAKQVGAQINCVPSRGPSSIISSLLGGHSDAGFSGGVHYPQAKAGKIKTLTMTTSNRSSNYPDVPTASELFDPSYVMDALRIIVAPKGFPEEARTECLKAISEVITTDEFKAFVNNMHFVIDYHEGEDLQRILDRQVIENKKMLGDAAK